MCASRVHVPRGLNYVCASHADIQKASAIQFVGLVQTILNYCPTKSVEYSMRRTGKV